MIIKARLFIRIIIAICVVGFLTACATVVNPPAGAEMTRSKLMLLQGDPELATRAPIEIQDAELAVAEAEKPEPDMELGQHRVFIADRKVDIARFWAESRFYLDQREALSQESEQARLDSRTREADRARIEAEQARLDAQQALTSANLARNQAIAARSDTALALDQANSARTEAELARQQADSARNEAALALNEAAVLRREAEELANQILELNARNTDRGLIVTLGDVLFQTGDYTIQGGSTAHLDKLAEFLNQYEDRTVSIEGHTDSVGSAESNYRLSLNRADSVKDYLVSKGISASRLTTRGQGEDAPVSDNESATGRQQNRRVEVIIANSDPSL